MTLNLWLFRIFMSVLIIAGLTTGNVAIAIGVTIVVLVIGLAVQHTTYVQRTQEAEPQD